MDNGYTPVFVKVKFVNKDKIIYYVSLEIWESGRRPGDVSESTDDERSEMETMFRTLHQEAGSYQDLVRIPNRRTTLAVCNAGRVIYRLDTQTYGLANIHIQKLNLSLACCNVIRHPNTDDLDLRKRSIDDGEFGFPMNDILWFLEQGLLQYSSRNRSKTEVRWSIIRQPQHKPVEPETFFRDLFKIRNLAVKVVDNLKITGKMGGKMAVKETGKFACKGASKGVGKSAAKKVPVVGFFAGICFAISRLTDKDYTGAGMEVASGIASLFPGLGTATSIAIDVALLAKDFDEIVEATFNLVPE